MIAKLDPIAKLDVRDVGAERHRKSKTLFERLGVSLSNVLLARVRAVLADEAEIDELGLGRRPGHADQIETRIRQLDEIGTDSELGEEVLDPRPQLHETPNPTE